MSHTFRKKSESGFTLAEVLLAVAIIIILAGVAFISVITYRRNLKLLEMDNAAHDIFVAAQNHLSSAIAQGKINVESEVVVTDKAVITNEDYLVVVGSSQGTAKKVKYGGKIDDRKMSPEFFLDMILPDGSIDAFVKGKYFTIHFDPVTGTVLEVFYSDNYDVAKEDYANLLAVKDNKEARKRYGENRQGIIGYYGDVNGLDKKPVLAAPRIILHNEEILYLEVICDKRVLNKKNEAGFDITKLLSVNLKFDTGSTSPTLISPALTNLNTKLSGDRVYIILDDATSENNTFKNLIGATNNSLLGMDFSIQVRMKETTYANSAFSAEEKGNSLFQNITKNSENNIVSGIGNFRHLMNLTYGPEGQAEQKSNLNWDQFEDRVKTLHKQFGITETESIAYKYKPITLTQADLEYDGKNLYINGVQESTLTEDAGIFGKSTRNLTVKDLELRNISFETGGNAGALIGSLKKGTNPLTDPDPVLNVSNVIAYNTEKDSDKEKLLRITSSGGSAGGLIGSATEANVTNCAAAVYVEGKTNAGGLIGTINNGSVTYSYAGGHTAGGVFNPDLGSGTTPAAGRVNVYASGENGIAGGLIGNADNEVNEVSNNYSTCSVYGVKNTADNPGFIVGNRDVAAGDNPKKNYGYGWCYKLDASDASKLEIIYPDYGMENFVGDSIIHDRKQEKNTEETTQSKPKYNYDSFWDKEGYPYNTVSDIASSVTTPWFMTEHVGDWAYPGYLVDIVNTPATPAAGN